jgi:hypothetical protein
MKRAISLLAGGIVPNGLSHVNMLELYAYNTMKYCSFRQPLCMDNFPSAHSTVRGSTEAYKLLNGAESFRKEVSIFVCFPLFQAAILELWSKRPEEKLNNNQSEV